MIPSPYDIKYFHVVAETFNLSRASERLGVVQPTLSQSLKRLEESVGKPLFVRSTGGLTLTRAGQEFLVKSKILFEDWERITKSINDLDHVPSGKFNLGCHPSVGLYSLNLFMKDLMVHPDLEINLTHGLSREITEMIISRKVDVGLVINPVKHNDLVLKKLCSDRVGFWSVAKAPQDILIFDDGLTQAQTLLRKNSNFKKFITSSNLEVIGDLVASGCGVGILPERVAKRFKGLKPFADSWFTDELYLAYRVDASKTAGFKAITDAISKAKI